MDEPGIATLLIYSGRPDPQWLVGAAELEDLRRRYAGLPLTRATPATPPPLGYRGCCLRSADAEWVAYGAVVTCKLESGSVEHRSDPGRQLERALLATAPVGVVPELGF